VNFVEFMRPTALKYKEEQELQRDADTDRGKVDAFVPETRSVHLRIACQRDADTGRGKVDEFVPRTQDVNLRIACQRDAETDRGTVFPQSIWAHPICDPGPLVALKLRDLYHEARTTT